MRKDHPTTVGVDENTCVIHCPDDNSHRRDQDTFGWTCHHGDLEINFNKNGTPFQNGKSFFTARVHQRTQPSAIVDPAAPLKAYEYSVKVTLPNDKVCLKDPQIIIDNGRDFDYDSDLLASIDDVSQTTQSVLSAVVAKMKESEGASRLFFPTGIELISIDVKVGVVEVHVKVAGPKAGSDA